MPGPRVAWVAAWALIPWLNAGANLLLDTGARTAIWEQSRARVITIATSVVAMAVARLILDPFGL